MGPLKGGKNRNDDDSKTRNLIVDPSFDDTQQIDSQFSPGDYIVDSQDDDFEYPDNTMPVDDTYLLEDEFETQLMNLAGETQMVDLDEETQLMDFAGETQVMDFAGETQVMDFAGETQVVDLAGETQALDDLDCMDDDFFNEYNDIVCADSEDEETNNADIICETQDLSHDDPVKNDDTDSVGLRSSADKDSSREGSVCRGFTEIRAASVRASGLAANARRTSGSSSTSNDNASVEKATREQDGSSVAPNSLKSDREENNFDKSEKLRNSNNCKVGSRAVRQLFRDDENAEVCDSDTDVNKTDDNLDVPEQLPSEHGFAGLSYANSQEPGDLSQAHALEVVDKFLDHNFTDCDKLVGRRVSIEKPKVVSGVKGSRDLAKSSTLKSKVEDCGIYDWDDTREDDGGGEFFTKKKELFFPKGSPKQRSLPEPRKAKIPGLGNVKTVGDCVEKITEDKIGDPAYSDSRALLPKSKSNGKSLFCGEKAPQKNLIKKLLMPSGDKLVDKDSDKDVPDVGPDTQMAAEAMENLCFELHLADSNNNNNGTNNGARSITKAAKGKKLRNGTARLEENLVSSVPYPNGVGVLTRQAKRTKRISTSNELSPIQSKKNRKKRYNRVLEETEERLLANANDSTGHGPEATGRRSGEKRELKDQLHFCVPVAHRTRKSSVKRQKVSANSLDARNEINNVSSIRGCGETTAAIDKTVITEKARKVGSTGFKQSNISRGDTSGASNNGLRGLRSRRSERLNKSSEVAASIDINTDRDLLNNSSACNSRALPCSNPQSKKRVSLQTVRTRSSRNAAAGANTPKQSHEKSDGEALLDGAERTGRQEASPIHGTSSTCATPANCTTPKVSVSPICMGDEYHKQSISSSIRHSLLKEISDLKTLSPVSYGESRESRKRKDITSIRVLFSQHLDVDVVKKQKKILARVGGAVASTMSEATHFVADEFVRTRNMLEAIAFGKPVVTHLWIESCDQASCLIDEKNYILRDAKKEKELGFALPVSLARACQHPLLQGLKVLVTPNTKPSKDILANLVKAVQGLVVERLGRSVLKNKKLPDDLLILSCEEDHEACIPYLEKGSAIYSSELLLNGIVTQKLEYERHRLFVDDVRRTRSTIWVKKNNKFLPVTK